MVKVTVLIGIRSIGHQFKSLFIIKLINGGRTSLFHQAARLLLLSGLIRRTTVSSLINSTWFIFSHPQEGGLPGNILKFDLGTCRDIPPQRIEWAHNYVYKFSNKRSPFISITLIWGKILTKSYRNFPCTSNLFPIKVFCFGFEIVENL